MRRVLLLFLVALVLPAHAAAAPAGPIDDTCRQASPIALPCTGLDKLGEAAAAECRRLGLPDSACALPLGHTVIKAARDAYLQSWTHRAAAFQYRLSDSLPLGSVQWLGTHNSFNSVNDTITISHTDSNQQLSLTDQLDIDVRAIEIDIHFINGVPTVCHGQGPDAADLGCTTEGPLSDVLAKIAGWLNAHPGQVILLYVEDEMKNAAAYPLAVAQFDTKLRRPDGSSLIYRPDRRNAAPTGCVTLPRSVSRRTVRKAGAQIVMVGNCVKGWSSDVHNWNPVEVESGSTENYKPFPACDATYKRDVYAAKIVRYFEDSTFVATAVDPQTPAVDPGALTPAKVAAMTACGVNLFGLDQLLPDDGRIAATIFSWAPGEPRAGAGDCTVMRPDGRWVATACTRRLRAGCRTATGWRLSRAVVARRRATAACHRVQGSFVVPRTGYENSLLHQAVAGRSAWLAHQAQAAG